MDRIKKMSKEEQRKLQRKIEAVGIERAKKIRAKSNKKQTNLTPLGGILFKYFSGVLLSQRHNYLGNMHKKNR